MIKTNNKRREQKREKYDGRFLQDQTSECVENCLREMASGAYENKD
jgi:hypothetical protein